MSDTSLRQQLFLNNCLVNKLYSAVFWCFFFEYNCQDVWKYVAELSGNM